MSHRHQADRLLARLAEELRAPDLKLDAQGALVAALDGTLFSFHYDEQREVLFIQADGGRIEEGPELRDRALEKALAANFLWRGTAGGVLGLDGEGRFNLAYRLDFPLDRPGEEERDYEDALLEILPHLAGAAGWARDLAEPIPVDTDD